MLNKIGLAFLAIFIVGIYLFVNSIYYRMVQLDHMDDRIRFGRLEFHRNADFKVADIEVHNREKIFTVNFKGDQVFAGHMDHFLIFMQANATISPNQNGFYNVQDQPEKICKIQQILSVYPFQQNSTIQIHGRFSDCNDANYKISLFQTDQNKLIISIKAPQKYKRVYILFNNEQHSHYYGLGEQFSYLNLGKNRPFSTFTRQKGIGRGEQPLTSIANIMFGAGGSYYTSNAPMPIWFSSKRIAYVLNSAHYMAWMNNKILVWSNDFSLTYIKGSTYKQLVSQVAIINGYTKTVPDWVNQGAILGLQGVGADHILGNYLALKEQGAKITGIWVQDWVSKKQSIGCSRLWWNQQLDQEQSKNWDKLKEQLKTDNVKILIYASPLLYDLGHQSKLNKNHYKIAEQMGYLVKLKNKNGQNFKIRSIQNVQASFIDFENQEATNYFKYLVGNALKDTQASGMMVDFSEIYPSEGVADSIEQGVVKHNQYPNVYYKKLDQIVMQILGEDHDFYIFTKAGHLNSPKYAHSLWTGYQAINFNFHTGLPSCLTAILSSGLVGYSNTHCDIGGQNYIQSDYLPLSQRTQMLLVRWMELSAFTAVFRTNQGNLPESSLQVYSNPYLSRIFAFYSQIFQVLSEYRKQQTKLSQNQKIPLVRALFLQLEGIEGTQELQDQFFLGSQIYAAPFLSQQFERKYFLPKGEWKSLWNGKVYKGCDCQRTWKETLPAVFIRTSSKFCDIVLQEIAKVIMKYQDVVYIIPKDSPQQL